jgi:hypothetical protein
MIDIEWGYTFAGLLVGFIVGMTGVGGGSLMTPLLIFFFSIKPAVAVGTDLLFAAITKSGGIFVHQRRGTIEWKVVSLLSLGSLPMALVSVMILDWLKAETAAVAHLITFTLGVALLLTATVLLMRSQLHRLGNALGQRFPNLTSKRNYATVAAGAILGILVPLTSVGAGALGAAMLTMLYPWMPTKRIVGIDLAHAVPLTLIAGLGHMHLGTVDFTLLASLLIGSLPGIYLGSHTSAKVPDHILRPVLAGMLILIGVKFIVA